MSDGGMKIKLAGRRLIRGEKNTKRTISELRSADLREAKKAIAKGVRESQERWIEAGLIAEALTAELVKIAQNSGSESQIATLLRTVAARLESEYKVH